MNNSTSSISRRRFLQSSALTTASLGLTFASPHIQSRAAEVGSGAGEGIRVGIIGTGGQGRSHMRMPAMQKSIVALCDVDKQHLAEAQKMVEDATGRKPAGYSDYRKMLESREVDAVLIATPDHWHALQSVHACQAGKDVYCEKPLSLTVAEGRAMLRAARDNKRIVQTGSQQRSDDKFRRACEYVRSGRIGDIKVVRVGLPGVNYSQPDRPDSAPPPELDYDMWLGPAPQRPYNQNRVHYNFRFFWDYSGGQMTNWGAHHLDIAQWGLGTDESGPVHISARAEFDPAKRYEVPSWFDITYKYANGIQVLCGQSHRQGTTFESVDGILYCDRGKLQCTVKGVLEEPLAADEVHLYKSQNHHTDWFECIKSRKLPICDVAIGHRSATVCHLGSIAVRLGRPIQWDPQTEKIVGDEEASKRLGYAYRSPWKLPGV